ncbi:MAG: TAT-variant-translocated molybdopterin oxidoreductase, partial [Candidatus Kryptoniota bacterium]
MSDSTMPDSEKGRFYWKSLKELHDDPSLAEAKANEFMSGAADEFKLSNLSDMSRRKFVALLTASAAFAASGCSSYENKGEVIPYNKEPVGVIPGVPNYYASTCTGCKHACGTLITTQTGRPVKINGNDEHPVNKGKLCPRGQASILGLYDPERLREPLRNTGHGFVPAAWAESNSAIINSLRAASSTGKEIAVVLKTLLSPTAKQALQDFAQKYPTTKFYSYEVVTDVNRNSAWQKSYGGGQYPLINWDKAKFILALEADFLGKEGNMVEQMRMYASTRSNENLKSFSRLVVVEAGMSITGMNADSRLKLRPERQFDLVMSILNELIAVRSMSRFALDKDLSGQLGNYSLAGFAKENNIDKSVLDAMVSYIIKSKNAAIVYAGDKLPEQVHIAVNLLNEVIGGAALYRTDQARVQLLPYSSQQELEQLVNRMNAGQVGAVIHYESNPVFHFAPDLGYREALVKVPASVTLTKWENETSVWSSWVLPINHDLESWNDFKNRTGIYSLQQPIIYPLYSTRQKEAVILAWTAGIEEAYHEDLYHEYLMNRWQKDVYSSIKPVVDYKMFWNSALEDGVVTFEEKPETYGSFDAAAFKEITPPAKAAGYTVILEESYVIGDGEFANNGWLQELPQPVTKVVWDNYASVSPDTAKELGVDYNDIIEVKIDSRVQKLPVYIQPGMADRVVAVDLGYGRTKAGTVGSDVGVDANVLLSKEAAISHWIYTGGTVTKAAGNYLLVTTMEHNFIDENITRDMEFTRNIIHEGTIEEYERHPDFIKEETALDKPTTIYKNYQYEGVKWGMSIDLNKCTGCSACVISCEVENNTPVVGKDQVKVSREMAWIRIDRYYSGTPAEPKISLQPMLCQQCDDAPCENVCPVAATSHSPDGLNMMIYNRCVGTRYCSNNCPYKVRRFNFFNFRYKFDGGYYSREPVEMVNNPEVTVRSRGVMEKCTFCV